MKEKTCTLCRETKSVSEFNKGKGYVNGIRSRCRSCEIKEHKKYYQRKKLGIKKARRKFIIEEPKRYWCYSTFHGHKRRNYVVALDREYLFNMASNTDHCEICGCELNWGKVGKYGSPLDNSPTLDRTNNEDFLAPHNVQIVCRNCNMTKNARNMKEFVEYCKMIAEKFSDDPTI